MKKTITFINPFYLLDGEPIAFHANSDVDAIANLFGFTSAEKGRTKNAKASNGPNTETILYKKDCDPQLQQSEQVIQKFACKLMSTSDLIIKTLVDTFSIPTTQPAPEAAVSVQPLPSTGPEAPPRPVVSAPIERPTPPISTPVPVEPTKPTVNSSNPLIPPALLAMLPFNIRKYLKDNNVLFNLSMNSLGRLVLSIPGGALNNPFFRPYFLNAAVDMRASGMPANYYSFYLGNSILPMAPVNSYGFQTFVFRPNGMTFDSFLANTELRILPGENPPNPMFGIPAMLKWIEIK
ncbi:MAG: hypothetical protein HQK52_13590 [Oligoflexia bacterium]|nr:hypothetical protein [Oligoflexia bacterium]